MILMIILESNYWINLDHVLNDKPCKLIRTLNLDYNLIVKLCELILTLILFLPYNSDSLA